MEIAVAVIDVQPYHQQTKAKTEGRATERRDEARCK